MKKISSFKSEKMMLLIASFAIANVSSIHGKDYNQTMVDEVFPKTFILGTGWTALSGTAFIGKKIFNNLAVKHPLEKEHYLKMAKRSRNVSQFSAIPLISWTLSSMTCAICLPLADKYPKDSSTRRVLDNAPQYVVLPALLMTFIPAAYSSGLHKATHDLPCETPRR